MEDLKLSQDQAGRINKGDKARSFLASYEWTELVKPIIDSMIAGVVDVRNLKSADISSDAKAKAEVIARKLTADYLSEIETFLLGYVEDARVTTQILEQKKNRESLYKEVVEQ